MKNVIKEFDKEFTVTKGDNSNGNNDYFECPEDVQPVYVRTFILKALADQLNQVRRIIKNNDDFFGECSTSFLLKELDKLK